MFSLLLLLLLVVLKAKECDCGYNGQKRTFSEGWLAAALGMRRQWGVQSVGGRLRVEPLYLHIERNQFEWLPTV